MTGPNTKNGNFQTGIITFILFESHGNKFSRQRRALYRQLTEISVFVRIISAVLRCIMFP